MKFGRYFIVVILCMGLLILFGERGLIDYMSLKGKRDALRGESARIEQENDILRKKIVLLRSDARYIEKIARDELGMVKKGDIVYRFVE